MDVTFCSRVDVYECVFVRARVLACPSACVCVTVCIRICQSTCASVYVCKCVWVRYLFVSMWVHQHLPPCARVLTYRTTMDLLAVVLIHCVAQRVHVFRVGRVD